MCMMESMCKVEKCVYLFSSKSCYLHQSDITNVKYVTLFLDKLVMHCLTDVINRYLLHVLCVLMDLEMYQ